MEPDENAHDVVVRIREALRAANISQETVAQRLGLTQQAISRRFTGAVDFSLSELTAIAELLELSLTEMLEVA